jgi:exodeoxyribonuclease-3
MKIASWNINGIKARHDVLIAWLKEASPDVVGLQEIKSVDENFPRSEIEALGYNLETHGQKGFNGVALLSKLPFDEVNRGLPLILENDEDEQARFIEGIISTPSGVVRIVSLYLPNGNPVGENPMESDKYSYKLRWMDRLHAWTQERLKLEEPLVLAGDYNVIPEAKDCHAPDAWWGDALYRPETLEKFQALKNIGLTEAFRASTDEPNVYTFWDYQAGAWPRNNGIRIDHMLLSCEAADRLNGVQIDKYVRDWEKPSDHVPILIELDV